MRGSTGLFAAALAAAIGTSAAAEIRFTFATTNGPQDLSSQAVMRWKEALESRSNGAIRMEFITGGALGGDQELLQQLSTNEIQMNVAGPVIVHRLLQEYQCLEAEYVYADEAHGMRVWTGEIGREVSEALRERYDIEVVAVGARGARHLTANRAVRTPDDLRGVKVRVTNPLRGEVFAAYGALPGSLPVSELYGGLRQGVFDAQENPIPTIFGNRFYEVQTHINLTGHVWSYNVITANSQFLASMTPEQRSLFDETLAEAIEWLNEAVASDTQKLLDEMVADGGVEVVESDVAAFRAIAQPIVARYAEANCKPGLLEAIERAAAD